MLAISCPRPVIHFDPPFPSDFGDKKIVDKYVTNVTISLITVIEMTAIASSTFALHARPAERAAARVAAYAELQEMSKAMVQEKGLLNYAQAGLLLDVSTKRISELVRLGKLKRFDFLGRTYVSMREVGERYQQELRAGRPRKGVGKRAVASIKAALKTDIAQAKLGGYGGPYVRACHQAQKEKSQEELKKVWRAITKGPNR
jgi:hypothetical protein